MRLSTSLIVVALTMGASFLIYSTRESESPQLLQANIVESLPPQEPEPANPPQVLQVTSSVEVTSTEGLDEEWSSILEGYEEIQGDFDRLEPPQTATGAGN